MISRILTSFVLLSFFIAAGPVRAYEVDENVDGDGFAKPYEYERQAYGYDPEGVDYHENQPEDFQVILITSAPFTALASYGLTGLASLAIRNSFDVDGDYFIPFLAGTVVGSTTIACVSVLTNKYPPPAPSYVLQPYPDQGLSLGSGQQASRPLVFHVPLVSARF